jgi:hypothetical protein
MHATANSKSCVASWIDPNTGRRVRQITDLPAGAKLGYFRTPKQLPDGRLVAHSLGENRELLLIDAATGDVQLVIPRDAENAPLGAAELSIGAWDASQSCDARTGLQNVVSLDRRRAWRVALPSGVLSESLTLPDEVKGLIALLQPGRRAAIVLETRDSWDSGHLRRNSEEAADLWAFLRRDRSARLSVYDFETRTLRTILETSGTMPAHLEFSPAAANLLRYSYDLHDAQCQRIWTTRLDDGLPAARPIRPQAYGEFVTHEFWWPGAQFIAYTYQDRRGDETIERLPWAEYAPVPSYLGIADLEGREIYRSAPLNTYHTHLYVSPDAQFVSGEGTDGNCFVHAARFSFDNETVAFEKLATIHTPYQRFQGQKVDCNFSADSKWLLFNDEIDGKFQVCAVEVDV